ncbi:hypothetical protein [Varibaculum cambriense]|uniref:hypothetical protein n=1 Tax=Varibaculum cambriense TaxID=184870 RepID=UPI0025523EF0|nr:hypothetical protein [Varibaculum cambriense]MDK8275296.1 hypothetical protein [Varibaculum cambriense]
MRSLSNHRGALPRDCEAQQRAIDAADALVKAIIAAGFKLEGMSSQLKVQSLTGIRSRGARL